ncbi:hypothetical protein CC86DRAFT_439935 [Ophiobolus disseminans]|uniref:BTB domain-containing protein n=1 Tax=Ophiobolus disseminans TaxID=1469910 RepID=A0A6A7A3Q3_9PLEO|nr:hypothetical protein CC86DRAFT_439935 [Ophiobolus disseminans]
MHDLGCRYYKPINKKEQAEERKEETGRAIRTTRSDILNYVNSSPILVKVGTGCESQNFIVHKDLVLSRSVFFQNALNGSWIEADERLVPLPEDEPALFSLYLKLPYVSHSDQIECDTDKTSTDSSVVADKYAVLSKLYVLADKLMDDTAKETILAAILARSKEAFKGSLYYPAIDSIQIIYEGTREGSPARQLMVDLYTDFVTSSFVAEKAEAVPKEFLHDLFISLLTKRAPVKGA